MDSPRCRSPFSDIGDPGSDEIMDIDAIFETMPISSYHYKLLIMCGLLFMCDAMEVSLLSFLATCAGNEWGLTDVQRASISAVVFSGQLFGGFFWGPIADRYGRKVAFLCACSLIVTFGFLSASSRTYEWLLTFRAIVGFGVGGLTVPFDLLAEFLPSAERGKYLLYIEYFWTLGSLFVAGIAWLFLDTIGWRGLCYVVSAPVAICSVISIVYLPESPRWLLLKGRISEAEAIVRNLAAESGVTISMPYYDKMGSLGSEKDSPGARSFNSSINSLNNLATMTSSTTYTNKNYYDPITPEKALIDQLTQLPIDMEEEQEATILDLFRTPHMRRITIALLIIWFSFGFTYYGIIILVTRIYTTGFGSKPGSSELSKACSFDYQSIMMNSSAELFGVFFCILVIDKWGRTRTQAALYGLGGVAVMMMAVQWPSVSLLPYISMIARLAAMGSSCATWVVTPELYPTEMRATGHSVCSSCARAGAFLSPYFVISDASLFTVGSTLAIVNFMAAGVALFFLPETKGARMDGGDHTVDEGPIMALRVLPSSSEKPNRTRTSTSDGDNNERYDAHENRMQ